MFIRRFVVRFILTILLIAVFVGGGYALYRAGISTGVAQGYLAARMSQANPGSLNDGTPALPAIPYYPGWPYGLVYPFFPPFHPFLGFLGVLFLIGLVFFPLLIITRLLIFRGFMHRAAMAGGPWGKEGAPQGDWSHHGPWMHHGPWSHRDPASQEGQKPESEKKQPDTESK